MDDVQGEGETIFTGIVRVEKLAWAMCKWSLSNIPVLRDTRMLIFT